MKAESPRKEDCRMTCRLNSQVGTLPSGSMFSTLRINYLYLIQFNSFGIINKFAHQEDII